MNMRYPAPGLDDIEWADGIIFGTPTRFGNIASELKVFIDALGGLWAQGAFTGKTSSAFCTTSARHGTNETTIVSMFLPMLHLGLIIVPSGYGDPAMHRGGTPYGATAVSGKNATIPGDDDVAAARYQGRRMALVTTALRML